MLLSCILSFRVHVKLYYRIVSYSSLQELDVQNKKRKSDHQHFTSHHRRRPRDLEHLATSLTTHRAPAAAPDVDSYSERTPEDDDDPVGPAEDQYSTDNSIVDPAADSGDRYEESPEVDNMAAGDSSHITLSRRGKLVTFYRNGDSYYKVNTARHGISVSLTVLDILTLKARKRSVFPTHLCLTPQMRETRKNFWMKLTRKN